MDDYKDELMGERQIQVTLDDDSTRTEHILSIIPLRSTDMLRVLTNLSNQYDLAIGYMSVNFNRVTEEMRFSQPNNIPKRLCRMFQH